MKSLKFICPSLIAAVAAVGLSSCHCHHFDNPEPPFRIGQVLCTDGSVESLCDFVKTTKEAIGIVFYVNEDPEKDFLGYAVYINDDFDAAFSEDLHVAQGTSMSLSEFDGNENTYAMYSCEDVKSPIANQLFDMWKYGQSAYMPSVAQLKLLFANRDFVNKRIEAVGGDPIYDSADQCWFWSYTEVEGLQADKAWLFSMNSGMIQETPKTQSHKMRPIVTIKR